MVSMYTLAAYSLFGLIKRVRSNAITRRLNKVGSIAIMLFLVLSIYTINTLFGVTVATRGYSSNFNDEWVNVGIANRTIAGVTAADVASADTRLKTESSKFFLEIPSINLRKNVIENVDPSNENIYGPVIEKAVAHGKYTRLPDEAQQDGNVYLFAHRDGHVGGNFVGYFSRLGELRQGDTAIIDYAGKRYTYVLLRSFIITPEDTWVYTSESKTPMLTLQTCEQGETMRLIVQWQLQGVSLLETAK